MIPPYPERVEVPPSPVYLAKPVQDDLPFIQRLWGDAVTMEPVGGPIRLTDAAALEWYGRMVVPGRETDRYFLIRDSNTNQRVGEASLHRWDHTAGRVELNIKILHGSRGQGRGDAALELLLDYFFAACAGKLLVDDVAIGNDGGVRLLLRHGFRLTETTTEYKRLELTRAGWSQRRSQSE